jgi:hypothetical protein
MIDPLSISIPLAQAGPPEPIRPIRKLLTPSADHPGDYTLEVDYSEISNFLACPRRFENHAIHSREAVKPQLGLLRGDLIHKIEEQRLKAGGLTDAVKTRQQELISDHFQKNPPPHTDFRSEQFIRTTVEAYNKKYAQDGLDRKVLIVDGEPFVERPFKIELTSFSLDCYLPYRKHDIVAGIFEVEEEYAMLKVRNLHILYTGKIDCVLEEAGHLWVEDHKTSSRGGNEFSEAFRLSLQTRGYCWAVQKLLSRPVMGCIVNAIIWRAPTKTGKGTEFQRPTYFYSADSLLEWEENMLGHCENLVGMLTRGHFPQISLSFKSPCAGCDYAENCALPRHQRQADLSSALYRDVTWNPMHN